MTGRGDLAPIRDRLAKLVPLLGSDQPGEVTATAAAIGRLLASVGATWHDLARALVPPAARPAPPPSRPRPQPQRPAPARHYAPGFYSHDWNPLRRAVDTILATDPTATPEDRARLHRIRRGFKVDPDGPHGMPEPDDDRWLGERWGGLWRTARDEALRRGAGT
jgi:hypothetical protein